MPISKKIMSVLLSVIMLLSVFSIGVAVSAATPATQTLQAEAGKTVKIKFSEDCYGCDGTISYSNRALFSSVSASEGEGSNPSITDKKFLFYGNKLATQSFEITVKISDSAAVGDKCVVTFAYDRSDEKNGDGPFVTKTVTVEVIEKKTTSKTTQSTSKSTQSTSKTTGSTMKPTSKPTSKPTTSTTKIKLDLTELNKQIAIAEDLKEADYTADSWNDLEKALSAAKKARKATKQSAVNTAADNLKDAIAALVRIDDTQLEELIATVNKYLSDEDMGKLVDDLLAAIKAAENALKSGNQDAINKAYNDLSAAFDAYKKALEELGNKVIEVEKPIEVEPKDPYCNIWLHQLWLILLIVSVILNVILVVVTVRNVSRRKNSFVDDMPLIDYDINDD